VEGDSKDMLVGILCALGCEVLFGLSYIFTKQATNVASPLSLVGWRFLVAILVMAVCVAIGIVKINFKEKSWRPVLLVAFFCPIIYFIGETLGINYTTASESGAFLACIPVFCLIASTLFLKRKPFRQQVIGIGITLMGVLVTVLAVGGTASFSLLGYLMLLLAVASYSIYSILVEKGEKYSGGEITFAMLLAGAIVFIALAVAEATSSGDLRRLALLPLESKGFLVAVLYQGIGCSVFAFFLMNVAISKIGVNRMSSFIGVSTVVSIMAGIFLLGETFTHAQIAGAILIVIGVYVANMVRKVPGE
jgi:drug/metabolite transporter (DMT)-like permease